MKLKAKAYLRIAAEDWHKKYDWVGDFSEGLASVRSPLNRKWGFVDEHGKEVIPPKYDSVKNFYGGLAEVGLKRRWGFIDKTGREIPNEYLTAVKLGGDIDRILEIESSK